MEKASGCANTFIRLLLYVLVALLIIALPLSILSSNTLRTFFSPDEISDSVASLLLLRGGVREQLTDSLISSAWSEQASPDQEEALKSLSAQDRLKIAQILFPKDWVSDQVRENLKNIFLWVESEEALPELKIDLVPLREHLQEGGTYRIAEIVVDSWPQCTIQQERQLERALQQDSSMRFELCQPRGELQQRLINFADQRLQQFIDNMPADIPLLEQLNPDDGVHALEDFRRGVLRILLLLNWLKSLPFLLLGLIMTFVIRSWRDLGRWWGIPLGMGALLTIFLIITGHSIGPSMLYKSFFQAEQVPEIQESIVNAVWDLIASVLNRSALQAILAGLIGLALFVLPQGSRKKTPEPVQPPNLEKTSIKRIKDIPPPPRVEPFDPDAIESSNEVDHANGSSVEIN